MSERVEDLSRRIAGLIDVEIDAFAAWLAAHWVIAPHDGPELLKLQRAAPMELQCPAHNIL